MMGADSVGYHRETVLERGDDFPGAALAYYASRGETPLVWGGSGAARLGLTGAVTGAHYDAVFGQGGASDPTSGHRLVTTKRPGVELVVAAHKSVAILGVIGRAEDMHAIIDAESDATVSFLDNWALERGGQRGRAQTRTRTSGLVWARTRHATSRAGDPARHDHILVANLVEMADDIGGWKALDTAGLRDLLHAATTVGRVAGARRAVELGYAIERDDGPSGKLGHWRIAGIPAEACELFSKRSMEIDAAVEANGCATPKARCVAARETRKAKRHTPVGDLLPGWIAELERAGMPVPGLVSAIERAAAKRPEPAARLTVEQTARVVAEVLDAEGPLAARKVFTRAEVIVAVGPRLFGAEPAELGRVVDRALADPETMPLIGVAGARDRAWTLASVVACEAAIASAVGAGCDRTDAPATDHRRTLIAIEAKESELGRPLTDGQRDAIAGICTSGRAVELVLGVAGAGKTTALDAVRAAFEAAGYRVVGTSVSGQAARNLGREAHLATSRTLASLLWRVDHDQLDLDQRTILLLDESGMTDDPALLRLITAAELAGAKLVMVGDDRQLGAVGPGGAIRALLDRHPGAVHRLTDNVRQADPAERAALADLRAGDVGRAVGWYASNGRIVSRSDRDQALDAVVAGWSDDVTAGLDASMLAWRKASVAELNTRARTWMAATSRLTGPALVAPGGQTYRAGDWIVTLAPGARGELVTSERGTVTGVDPTAGTLFARMDDGRVQRFGTEDTGAERLSHGYAVTVHRSQGSTVDTAHRLDDGGGRELAYVAMSRARQRSSVYIVADNVDQAAEDLIRDWSDERRAIWAIDAGTPASDPLAVEADAGAPAPIRTGLRRARLIAERAAVAAAIPPDPTGDLACVEHKFADARKARTDLSTGDGQWTGTPACTAARQLRDAQTKRRQAEGFSGAPGMSRQMRRTWGRDARHWAEREATAQLVFDQVAGPHVAELNETLRGLGVSRDTLVSAREARRDWLENHPEAGKRIDRLNAELRKIDLGAPEGQQPEQTVQGRRDSPTSTSQRPSIGKHLEGSVDIGL